MSRPKRSREDRCSFCERNTRDLPTKHCYACDRSACDRCRCDWDKPDLLGLVSKANFYLCRENVCLQRPIYFREWYTRWEEETEEALLRALPRDVVKYAVRPFLPVFQFPDEASGVKQNDLPWFNRMDESVTADVSRCFPGFSAVNYVDRRSTHLMYAGSGGVMRMVIYADLQQVRRALVPYTWAILNLASSYKLWTDGTSCLCKDRSGNVTKSTSQETFSTFWARRNLGPEIPFFLWYFKEVQETHERGLSGSICCRCVKK